MSFPGFTQHDFDVFRVPDFAARMGAIRTELRPKLLALGEALTPRLAELVPGPIIAHTAAHMRRRTNPPPATWVAFGRSPRGYKRYAHFRIALHEGGVRATVHVEDDSDDKPSLAAALQREPEALLARLAPVEGLVWFSLQNGSGAPVTNRELTAADLARFSRSLSTLKTADFNAGVPFARDDPRLGSARELPSLLLATLQRLAPLYEAALPTSIEG
jgi:uncharacterized protein YktB (UPF0637 family)